MKKFNIMKGYFMKGNKDIEKMLLNNASYEAIMKSKLEQEFTQELKKTKNKSGKKVITDIKKVPKDRLFSKDAVFSVINKNSKTKSYINGVQAEGYLGAQNSARENLLSGASDAFVSENSYVKFEKIKI